MTEDGEKQPDATAEGSRAGGAPAPAAGCEGRQPASGRNGDADGLQPRQTGRADGVKLGHGVVCARKSDGMATSCDARAKRSCVLQWQGKVSLCYASATPCCARQCYGTAVFGTAKAG